MKLACLAGLLVGGLMLACSDSDTIVALNVCTLGSVDAEAVDSLDVTIEPRGSGAVTKELEAVSVLPCGTQPRYNKRIKLGDGTEKGLATIMVEARDASGALLESAELTAKVRPEETTAVFVELGEEPMEGTGGMGGAAGAAGAGGEAGGGGAAGG